MHRTRPSRLERSCAVIPKDWARTAPPQPGFERLEAYFAGHGYDPHRHDTYAIGITSGGVQSFDYRGGTLHSLRGQAIVLHPDETHDGRAGTDAGFRYRMAYIAPRLIQDALGGRPLPFVNPAVSSDARLISAIAPALEDLHTPLDELQLDQCMLAISEALAALDRTAGSDAITALSTRAVAIAREFLDAHIADVIRSAQLEAVTGMSRYTLARHFRACLGTSPYRYVTMRRLDFARQLILAGATLADAAASSGFADQSHMTRQFRKAYGLPPGHWQRIVTRSWRLS